jgi:hypothetical protein
VFKRYSAWRWSRSRTSARARLRCPSFRTRSAVLARLYMRTLVDVDMTDGASAFEWKVAGRHFCANFRRSIGETNDDA